jgi:hypothetical protein
MNVFNGSEMTARKIYSNLLFKIDECIFGVSNAGVSKVAEEA